jgi:broad specificity phosphatase PhoE
VNRLYLIRHGQAGTRKAYDSLSELGRTQARLLGEFFAREEIHFDWAYSGELTRQRQTAEEARAACPGFPEIRVDPRWNEFDLDEVYRCLAPQLAEADPEFRREYEEMRAQAQAAEDDHGAPVHRRWMPCDIKIIAAWLAGTRTFEGETWEAFRTRVSAVRFPALPRQANIAVFTSATPAAIWAANTLEIGDERVMKLAGALYNASCTVLRLNSPSDSRLLMFNAIPHLNAAELRTWR